MYGLCGGGGPPPPPLLPVPLAQSRTAAPALPQSPEPRAPLLRLQPPRASQGASLAPPSPRRREAGPRQPRPPGAARRRQPHAATAGRACERCAGPGRAAPPAVSEARGMDEGPCSGERRRAVQVSGGGRAEPPVPLVPAAPPASAPPAAGRGRGSAAAPGLSPAAGLPSPRCHLCGALTAASSVQGHLSPAAAAAPRGRPDGGGDAGGYSQLLPGKAPAPACSSGRGALGGLASPRLPPAFGEAWVAVRARRSSALGLTPARGDASPGHRVETSGFSLPAGGCRSRRGRRGGQRRCGDLALHAPGPTEAWLNCGTGQGYPSSSS